ncbi:MAG: lectin-like protein [Myxococcota bacterium]
MASVPRSYTNWGSGEPNNSGNEDCGELRLDTGQWNDKECDTVQPFVCESF